MCARWRVRLTDCSANHFCFPFLRTIVAQKTNLPSYFLVNRSCEWIINLFSAAVLCIQQRRRRSSLLRWLVVTEACGYSSYAHWLCTCTQWKLSTLLQNLLPHCTWFFFFFCARCCSAAHIKILGLIGHWEQSIWKQWRRENISCIKQRQFGCSWEQIDWICSSGEFYAFVEATSIIFYCTKPF